MNWGNWNTEWADEQSQYYFDNDQYYGIVAGNVEINTFDFVLKLDENLAAIPAYRGIHIDEKTLILELTSEDITTKKSADHIRIHPEPGVRAKKIQNGADTSTKSSDDCARTPTQSSSDVTQQSPVKEYDSPSVSPHPEDTRLTRPPTQPKAPPKAQPKAHAIPSSNAAPRFLSPKTDTVANIPKPVRSDIIEDDDTRRRRRVVSNLDDCQLQILKKKMIDLKLKQDVKQDVRKPSEIADISPKTPTPRSGDIAPVKSSAPPSFYRKDDHSAPVPKQNDTPNVPKQYNTEAMKRKTPLEKTVPEVHKAVAQVVSSKVPLVPPDSKKPVAARRKIAAAAKRRVQKVDSKKVEVCISSDSPAESTLSSDSSDCDSSDISVSSSQIRSVSSGYSVSDSAITTGVDESLVCPKSHRLESFLTLESGWRCSVCNKKLKKKGEMFGCRSCDYDLCSKCADKARVATVETKCDKKKKRTRKAHKQKKETSKEKSDRKKEKRRERKREERRERKREEGVRREKEKEAKQERKRKKDKEKKRIKSVDVSVKSSSSSESEYSPVTSESDSDNSSEESESRRKSKSERKESKRRRKRRKKKTDDSSNKEESKKKKRRSRDSKTRKPTDKSKRRSRDSTKRKSKSEKRKRSKSDRKSKKRKRTESAEKRKRRKSKTIRDESVEKERSLSRTLSPTLSPPPSEEEVEKQEETTRKNKLFAPIGLIRKAAGLNREREHSKKRRRH